MGSTPSSTTSQTTVQTICIDQTNGTVEPRKSTSAGRPPSVTDRIRKSAGSLHSKSSASGMEKERRVQSLQNQLNNSEKRRTDAELFVGVLQKELEALELRNSELSEEIEWLRQQLDAKMPAAIPNMIPTLDEINELTKEQHHRKRERKPSLTDSEHNELKELREMKTKAKMERDLYENMITNLQADLRTQRDQCTQLKAEEEQYQRLEVLVKRALGDDQLTRLKAISSGVQGMPLSLFSEGVVEPSKVDKMNDNAQSQPPPPTQSNSRPTSHQSRQGSATFVSTQQRKRSAEDDEDDDIDRLLREEAVADILEVPPTVEIPITIQQQQQQPRIRSRLISSNNIFTLTDRMEPLKVMDNSSRPSTAASTSGGMTQQQRNRPHTMVGLGGRVRDVDKERIEQRKRSDVGVGVGGGGELPPPPARPINSRKQSALFFNRTRQATPTTHSRAHSHRSNPTPDQKDDEHFFDVEVDEDEVFSNSLPGSAFGKNARPPSGKWSSASVVKPTGDEDYLVRDISTSAKSRDSGYLGLGDSHNHGTRN